MDLHNTSIHLLQSQAQVELLDAIDKLRSDGVRHHISLPQLVVCGNTSSGKSSLLEALSGVRFPVGGDICTRFATELVLRHSPETSAKATISPGKDATPEHCKRISEFVRERPHLDALKDLIGEVEDVMGIKGTDGISNDVLHLEILGPKLPHLTLVDLPGLLRAAIDPKDIPKVENLVKEYMKEKRSVILAVVSAEDPWANQGVLSLANEFDPEGKRTMGIITKPDLLTQGGTDKQRKYLELAKNQHPRFKYRRAWHVLRNPDPSERENPNTFERVASEEGIFSQYPWNDLLKNQLGLDCLRKSLCDCLLEQICLELPNVISDIENEIREATRVINDLGHARDSSAEKRLYLTQISRKYEFLVQAALSGRYTGDEFFSKQSARLRAEIRVLTEAFELAMKRRGHTYELNSHSTSIFESRPGLPQRLSKFESLMKVGKLLQANRGPELPGIFNPDLIAILFREQSVNWQQIAIEYANDVCSVTEKFLTDLLGYVTPASGRTADLLRMEIFDDAMRERKRVMNEKIDELMTPYKNILPFSTKSRLESSLKRIESEDGDDQIPNDIPDSFAAKIVDAAACSKLLQWSRAYYSVALENFIDNVVVLGVENCILTKLADIFSADAVSQMSDTTLELLGGESEDISSQRFYARQKLELLQRSLKTCQKHVSREIARKSDPPKGLARELEDIDPETGSGLFSILPKGSAPALLHPGTGKTTKRTSPKGWVESKHVLPSFSFGGTPSPVPLGSSSANPGAVGENSPGLFGPISRPGTPSMTAPSIFGTATSSGLASTGTPSTGLMRTPLLFAAPEKPSSSVAGSPSKPSTPDPLVEQRHEPVGVAFLRLPLSRTRAISFEKSFVKSRDGSKFPWGGIRMLSPPILDSADILRLTPLLTQLSQMAPPPVNTWDEGVKIKYMSIPHDPEYRPFSFEELHLKDRDILDQAVVREIVERELPKVVPLTQIEFENCVRNICKVIFFPNV